jgi:hypothetical protein
MNQDALSTIDCRRAIEALRSGVPNRYAVRAMGCNQEEVERLFAQKLEQVHDYVSADKQVSGLLVSGDFGSGKSHLLEYLEDRALSEEFVCSRVVISKETPLYDPAKVYQAAIESALVPGHAGWAIQDLALRLHDTDEYARFYQWCNSASSGVSGLFAATLFLHDRLKNDPERVETIVNFWSGEQLAIAKIREGLKLLEAASLFRLQTVPAKRLALERFLFTARMIMGAGYKGWLLLIDELELVAQYSFLQRAKSYAELARWMGLLAGEHYPGLLAVGTITDDFDPMALQAKGDFSDLRPKLEARGQQALADAAEAGMRMIRSGTVTLAAPNQQTLDDSYERLKTLHARGYAWNPPEISRAQVSMMTRMRTHVRRWINEWDLLRLYPGIPFSIEEQQLGTNYAENVELEAMPKGADEA